MRSIDIDPQSPPRRVLILRLSALGDVLHCLPALEALRELWPVADFDWVSESLAASLLEGHPDLRRVIPFPRKEMSRRLRRIGEWGRLGSEWRAFAGELRRERYDLVIDFQGNLRSTLVSRVSRYRRRVGHHPSEVKEHPWLLPPASPDRPAGRVHRVEKNLHLVGALGWQGETPPGRLPDYATERRRLLSLPALEGAPPVILHPFVSPFGRFKEWPSSAFAVLARCLADRGRRVLVTSEPGSRGSAERIVRLSGGAAAPAPETPTVRDLAALLSLAAAVVAADTGPLHVAALSRVPAFGLYGPKDPAVYGPWSPCARTVRGRVPCSPCTLRRCEHAICMQMISPEAVARELEELLEEARNPMQPGGVSAPRRTPPLGQDPGPQSAARGERARTEDEDQTREGEESCQA